jgi:hypothetical protein
MNLGHLTLTMQTNMIIQNGEENMIGDKIMA